ncbi:type 1 fimbrial protein [Enterobacter ludwigii]|nr:type 1 fimbrial protein [Enterobacter ludwigii]
MLKNRELIACLNGILLPLLFLMPVSGWAEECANSMGCKIPVTFIGTYLESTCEVNIDGRGVESNVTLPTIATANLHRDGDEAGSRLFQIGLRSCPSGKNIKLRFVSAGTGADGSTGNLVNTSGEGMSRGVQVRLRNSGGKQLQIDDNNSFQQYVIPSSGEEVTHYYEASYYAKGTGTTTPGLVNAIAGVELVYN